MPSRLLSTYSLRWSAPLIHWRKIALLVWCVEWIINILSSNFPLVSDTMLISFSKICALDFIECKTTSSHEIYLRFQRDDDKQGPVGSELCMEIINMLTNSIWNIYLYRVILNYMQCLFTQSDSGLNAIAIYTGWFWITCGKYMNRVLLLIWSQKGRNSFVSDIRQCFATTSH